MKKMILGVAALSLLALASCKKDYTCECTTNSFGVTATSTTTINDTKKNAESACNNLQSSSSFGGQTISTTCTLQD